MTKSKAQQRKEELEKLALSYSDQEELVEYYTKYNVTLPVKQSRMIKPFSARRAKWWVNHIFCEPMTKEVYLGKGYKLEAKAWAEDVKWNNRLNGGVVYTNCVVYIYDGKDDEFGLPIDVALSATDVIYPNADRKQMTAEVIHEIIDGLATRLSEKLNGVLLNGDPVEKAVLHDKGELDCDAYHKELGC